MRPYLVLAVALSACASQPQNSIGAVWSPTPEQFQTARLTGIRLKRPDGSIVFVSGNIISNVLNAKNAMEDASGVKAELAIAETDQPNAFARIYQGRSYIALSTSYLRHLGDDQHALAVTIGHELAHIHLKHDPVANAELERTTSTVGAVLGTAANFVVPFSGYLVSAAASAYSRSFSRDEERDADQHGLRWAAAAGYDPCGKARVVATLAKYQAQGIPLLSTHPSYAERSDLANEYARKATGKGCE